MKIFGLCVVKDEGDIIEHALTAALSWCDGIFVYDNASEDNTLDVVRKLCRQHSRIVLHASDDRQFRLLRSDLYAHFRHEAAVGDWWCRLDADELYIDDPRIFLAKVPSRYDGVWNASFQYRFTDRDLTRFENEPNCYSADQHPTDRLRYYRNDWSELRFVRQTEDMVWPAGLGWPVHLGPNYPVRIWLRHFKYRSPEQIQRRLVLRLAIADMTDGRNFRHERRAMRRAGFDGADLWRVHLSHADEFDYDAHDGRLLVREELMPPIEGQRAPIRAFVRRMGFPHRHRASRK